MLTYNLDIDDPLSTGGSSANVPEPSSEQISMLVDMGFTPAQARKALRETVSSFCFVSFA